MTEDAALIKALSEERARILIVEDDPRAAARLIDWLSPMHEPLAVDGPQAALRLLAEKEFDLLIVSLTLAGCGRFAAVLADALARPHAAPADHHAGGARRGGPPAARARHGRQRLRDAARRPQRAHGARQNASEAQALLRSSAQPSRGEHRGGHDRSADWPAQPSLHGKPSGDAGRRGADAPAAPCRCCSPTSTTSSR